MSVKKPAVHKNIVDNYITKGRKTEWLREDTRAWYLARNIIDNIKSDFNIYDYGLTEIEQAEAVICQCGRWIKYCPALGWLVYNPDNGCWKTDYAEAATRGVVEYFAKLRCDGAYPENSAELVFCKSLMSDRSLNSIMHILMHHVNIEKNADVFDAEPHLLNCQGILVDLRDGTRRPAQPDDYCTRTTRFAMSEDADAVPEKFFEFLEEATSDNGSPRPDLAMWILTWFGYCLSGDVSAQFFVNFHGKGRNGKSVLLTLMYELFGDYASPLPEDIAVVNRNGGAFDLARLPGVRLAMLADAPEGSLNLKMLKPLVSGDVVNGKRKYKDDFDFRPVCKISIGSNPRLTLRETGLAVQRRLRLVPFDYVVPEEKVDPFLLRRLLGEGPAIISALIKCAAAYYRNGGGAGAFPACDTIDEASKEFIKSEDQVLQFVDENVEPRAGAAIKAQDFYDAYVAWTGKQGNKKPLSIRRFADRLGLLDIVKERRSDGNWYTGVRFKDIKEDAQPQK
jgi:putative DNA primase/helicase